MTMSAMHLPNLASSTNMAMKTAKMEARLSGHLAGKQLPLSCHSASAPNVVEVRRYFLTMPASAPDMSHSYASSDTSSTARVPTTCLVVGHSPFIVSRSSSQDLPTYISDYSNILRHLRETYMLPCESGCTGSAFDGKLCVNMTLFYSYCFYVGQNNLVHGFELSFQSSKSFPLFAAPGVTLVTHQYSFIQCYRGGTAKFRPVIPADIDPKPRPRSSLRRSTRFSTQPSMQRVEPYEYLGMNSPSPSPIVPTNNE